MRCKSMQHWGGKKPTELGYCGHAHTHAHTQLSPSNTSNMHSVAEALRSKNAFLLDPSLTDSHSTAVSCSTQSFWAIIVHKLNQANHPHKIQSFCNPGIPCGALFNNRIISISASSFIITKHFQLTVEIETAHKNRWMTLRPTTQDRTSNLFNFDFYSDI